jgi:hypothetical protein
LCNVMPKANAISLNAARLIVCIFALIFGMIGEPAYTSNVVDTNVSKWSSSGRKGLVARAGLT